ncbi:MAG: oxidoreductase [Flavobacteriaceae bacterium]|nr:oxidoreductase [Flavobacteriaceae bacterium]
MKRPLIIIVFCFFIIQCSKKHKPRSINEVSIKEFTIENVSIRAIKAIDNETLYFAGSNGVIGFTNNGGKSWVKNTLYYQDSIKPHFRSIALNNGNIFALSIANPALLYKITATDTTIVYSEKHDKVFYDSLTFFDDNIHGIAVGDPTEDCPSIIITKDGGETWEKITCDKLPKFEEGEAFYAASNTNLKTLGSSVWIASGGNKARVLRSDNYGKTWRVFNTPIIQGKSPQGIYSIDFANFKRGIVVGGDFSKPEENYANKAITKNGGKTWTLVANNQEPNYKSCVQYVPKTNGKEVFAVGKTGISYSEDGGLNWRKVSEEAYYSIQFVDKYTAWLSGNNKIGKLVLK